jgi:type I restriction-modification system DNA methylase subunit
MAGVLSRAVLSESDRKSLESVVDDLRLLLSHEEIPFEKIDGFLTQLKSEEAKSYIKSLRVGSKPESALRESFFAGNSVLGKYLFGEKAPEVRAERLGFIDYVVGESTRFILLELKTLFEATDKGLKQTNVKIDQHKDQILKYFQTGARYAILTNLKDWHFFNDLATPKDFKPFSSGTLEDFLKDYAMASNLWDVLERREKTSVEQDLDKWFFNSLKSWVNTLKDVEFTVDEKKKMELIIGLINKFIFIQTLDAYWVIDFRRIKTAWEESERKWKPRGKLVVLDKFFEEIDGWFFAYYDTGLFKTRIMDYIKKDDKNIDSFYERLQLVLGLAYWQAIFGSYRGIMQYNFKLINEDIFGKAYETFLAEVRHDEGIYYTPSYVTQYIVQNTVGNVFDSLLEEIRRAAKNEDFDRLARLAREFTHVRVLDPACGSGSFLIKAMRIIWEKYSEFNKIVKSLDERHNRYEGKITRPKEVEDRVEQIRNIQAILRCESTRELIARILVRHIHANDVDLKALEVAKVNIWLESVKLAPTEFNYEQLPPNTNRILPDLRMNFGNGDSVVGLPFDYVVKILAEKHEAELKELGRLREECLDDPSKYDLLEKIEQIKMTIRTAMESEFKAFLEKNELPEKVVEVTRPFHWPLEFWFLFFDQNGKYLGKEESGADIVVGNPPYVRIEVLNEKSPLYVKYLNGAGFESARGQYDLAAIFVERGYTLLNEAGRFGYIVSNKFVRTNYGEGARSFLSAKKAVSVLVDFGNQQVFEDASTYTALLFLNKFENPEMRYVLVRRLEHNLGQLIRTSSSVRDEDDFSSVTVKTESLTSAPWVFIGYSEEPIMNKLLAFPELNQVVERIFEGIHTSADSVYICQLIEDGTRLAKVHSLAKNKDYLIEKKLLRPLLKGKDIQRWTVDKSDLVAIFPYAISRGKADLIECKTFAENYPKTWRYLLENKGSLESRDRGSWKGRDDWYAYGRRQNLEQFDQPKLIIQVLARRATFALDLGENLYFVGGGNAGGYGISVEASKGPSLRLLCGLLNSSLLEWYLRKNSTYFRGGFYSYGKRFIEKLPIRVPTKAVSERIEQHVSTIVELKQKQLMVRAYWKETANKLKRNELTLRTLLENDFEKTKKGEFGQCWTKSVSYYPDKKDNVPDTIFEDFRVDGDAQGPDMVILGLDQTGQEREVYRASFQNRKLMLHVYHCITALLQSRAKVHKMHDLFEKTIIPVIQPNTRNTENVMAKIDQDLGKDKADVVKIDKQISDLEAEIDSEVFELYDINKAEASIVLDALGLSFSYKESVLEHLSG